MCLYLTHFLIYALFLPVWLQAAAPVTHAYLSYRFFDFFPKYTLEEKKLFLAGTLFPDIRYLGDVSRANTHYPTMTLKEVLNETSAFMAGIKYHSYVDQIREGFVIDQNIYAYMQHYPKAHLFTLLKLLEDAILFNKENWELVIDSLENVRPEELLWGFSKEKIELWHNMIRTVFTNSPETILDFLVMNKKGVLDVPYEESALWSQNFKSMELSTFIQLYVWNMVGHCNHLLKAQKK